MRGWNYFSWKWSGIYWATNERAMCIHAFEQNAYYSDFICRNNEIYTQQNHDQNTRNNFMEFNRMVCTKHN